jgi:tRNA(adenine34) deaminase
MDRVSLTGWIRVPVQQLAATEAELARHIALTRAEPGCLSFAVTPSPSDPLCFDVAETFVGTEAFVLHQQRAQNSAWGALTRDFQRQYEVSGLDPVAAKNAEYMLQALKLADAAAAAGEVPVGAILVRDDELIGQGFNQPIASCDPTAHAEIVALRHGAQAQGNYRLPGSVLYVTIEPCLMCVGALVHARVERVVFGAREPKAGALLSHPWLDQHPTNHRIEVSEGVLNDLCASRMSEFFAAKRR